MKLMVRPVETIQEHRYHNSASTFLAVFPGIQGRRYLSLLSVLVSPMADSGRVVEFTSSFAHLLQRLLYRSPPISPQLLFPLVFVHFRILCKTGEFAAAVLECKLSER